MDKLLKLVGGGSFINVAVPSSFKGTWHIDVFIGTSSTLTANEWYSAKIGKQYYGLEVTLQVRQSFYFQPLDGA